MRTGLRQFAYGVLALVRRFWRPLHRSRPGSRSRQRGVASQVETATAEVAGPPPANAPTAGLDDDCGETVSGIPSQPEPNTSSSEAPGVVPDASAHPIEFGPSVPAEGDDGPSDGGLPEVPQPPDAPNDDAEDDQADPRERRPVSAPTAAPAPAEPLPTPAAPVPAPAEPVPAPAELVPAPGRRRATRPAGDKHATPPRNIEGRRGGTPVPATRETRQYTPPPELTVRRAEVWEVVLVAASDDYQLERVEHDGAPLSGNHRECNVPSFTGSLTVDFGRDKPLELPLAGDTPMVFKLGVDWSGTGRRVSAITLGHFIVIAPRDWTRTGRVPVEPEDCTDSGFHAHYFHRERGDTTDVGGFNEYGRPLTRAAAVLEGTAIFDDSNEGDLFGGPEAPTLTAPGAVWARVGEEGKKKGWGQNFKLEDESLNEVLGGRQGRFYVRVYDEEPKLLDSCEFRYLRSLREISINGDPYTTDSVWAPAATGHVLANVRFVGIDGSSRFNLTAHSRGTVVEGGDRLLVEPHPDADSVSCTLTSEDGSVDVVLDLPRIWWRIECDGADGDRWDDTPTELTRSEFAKHAAQGAAIRVRLPRMIRSALVGFEGDLQKQYQTGREADARYVTLLVPLPAFEFHPEIRKALPEDVSLNLECSGTGVALVRVRRDPSPTKTITATVTPVSTVCSDAAPVAYVHGGCGGWRRGKGFSRGEVQEAAGASTQGVMLCPAIRIDRRRRTTHPDNVAAIGRAINAQHQ